MKETILSSSSDRKPDPRAQNLKDAMKDITEQARELCSEVEKLPAGEQQTKVSLLASELLKRAVSARISMPIVVESARLNEPTVWGVSFGGPPSTDELWVPCPSKEIAWRLHGLVRELVTTQISQHRGRHIES